MRIPRIAAAAVAIVVVSALAGTPVFAAPKQASSSIAWSGQGTSTGEGGATLNSSICGQANGAPVDGKYFVFVLSSTKALTNPTITFGTDSAVAMQKANSTKRGQSSYKRTYTGSMTLGELLAAGVTANYSGSATPTLTLSHGCTGESAGGPCATNPLASSSLPYINIVNDGTTWAPAASYSTKFLKPYATISSTDTNLYLPDNTAMSQAVTAGCLTVSAFYYNSGWQAWPTGANFSLTAGGSWAFVNAAGQPAVAAYSDSLSRDSFKIVYDWNDGSTTTSYTFYYNNN